MGGGGGWGVGAVRRQWRVNACISLGSLVVTLTASLMTCCAGSSAEV